MLSMLFASSWYASSAALAGEIELSSLPTLTAAFVPAGVTVGFNPQPDPPRWIIGRPLSPIVTLAGTDRELVLSVDADVRSVVLPAAACGTLTDTVLYPYPARDVAFPGRCGTGTFTLRVTTTRNEVAELEVSLVAIGGGSPASLVAFDPQPEPPGSVGIAMNFGTMRYTGAELTLGLRDARGTYVELR